MPSDSTASTYPGARARHQRDPIVLLRPIADVLRGSRFYLVLTHKRGFPIPAC
jgi:hypothetical protein